MPHASSSSEPAASPHAGHDIHPSGRRRRLFWWCLGLGLLALVLLVWLFGLTWWTLLIAVVLIACPVLAAWLLLGGLDDPPRTDR